MLREDDCVGYIATDLTDEVEAGTLEQLPPSRYRAHLLLQRLL